MRFHYVASQANNRVVEGDFEATSPAEVLEYLANHGLRPISLKTVRGIEQTKGWRILGNAIDTSDKIFLTKYLGLMLKVGTDLFRAIDILVDDLDKPAMKAFLLEVRSTLEKGQPFFTTFLRYPRYFSSVFVNLIKAGESSGNLEKVFGDLSLSLEKEQELNRSIKSSMTYPTILIIGSVIILTLLVTFALPKIAGIFSGTNAPLPTFSRIVFTVALFLNKYIWIFLLLAVISVVATWYFLTKTSSGKRIIYRFALKIPIIKSVLEQIALQRFAATLSSLLRAGLPILDALEITAQAVGLEDLKNSLIRISREGVARGLTIGEAFRREASFPRIVVNLIAISEKAGHTEDVLETLAGFYGAEVETRIKGLVRFLEPALLVVIGVIIAVIALSVLVPIYQLVGQF